MERDPHVRAATAIAALRVAVGALLTLAPSTVDRRMPDTATGSTRLLARTVGIRDVVLGLGTGTAARSGSDEDLERWLRVGLLSDGLDIVAGLLAAPTLGRRAVVSALIPVPVLVADLVLLASSRARTSTDHEALDATGFPATART